MIEDGIEKHGLGGAKMPMTSLKRGATKKASLKKNVKNTELEQVCVQKTKHQWWFSVSYVSVSSLYSEEWTGESGCTGQGFGGFGIKCQPVLVCVLVRPS